MGNIKVNNEHFFELTIPGNTSYLDFVTDCIKGLSKKALLKSSDFEMLLLGAEEAFTNMTKHAYTDEEHQPVKVSCHISQGIFQLSFFDRGIPFDDSIASRYEPAAVKDLASVQAGGIGLYLINTIFDEVRWINHGRDGKELRLKKIMPSNELSPDNQTSFSEETQSAKLEIIDVSLLVRVFEPNDALKISRCFYKSYGYTFENDAMFYPELFTDLVKKGDIISAVCIDQKNDEVVGHLALVGDKSSQSAEVTYAVVAPEYRKHGILMKLGLFLFEISERVGIRGISANATAHHVYSQKAALNKMFAPCAIVLGYFSVGRTYKKIGTEKSDKRISALFMFSYLKPPMPAELHPPIQHKKIIEAIYEKLHAPIILPESTDIILHHGEIEVHMDKMFKSSKIIISLIGKDTATEINRADF